MAMFGNSKHIFMVLKLMGGGQPALSRADQSLSSRGRWTLARIGVLREEVAGQRRYHAAKHHQLHRQHVLLHRTALVLFVLTFGAVLLHFVLHAAWLLIFTAFGPALAAALHGIGVKLEIGRLAGQSHAAEQELAALLASLDAFTPEATWEGWLRLRELTLTAAQVMSRENIQWQELLSHQSAELPA